MGARFSQPPYPASARAAGAAWPRCNFKKHPFHSLPKASQSVILKLHLRVFPTKDYLHKIGKEPSPNCQCGLPETIQHLLLDCPRRAAQRTIAWGAGRQPTLHQLLYGSRRDLESTVKFLFLARGNPSYNL